MLNEMKKGHPVLVVKYEDLRSDSLTQAKKMLEFLKVPYSDEELERRMMIKDSENFHRKNQSGNFNYYTFEQKQYLKRMIQKAVTYLKEHNNGTTYGIEDYL